MSYYENIKQMKLEINELIHQKKGQKVKISDLSIHYGMRYGFGRRVIENALKDFKDSGVIILNKDDFEVLE